MERDLWLFYIDESGVGFPARREVVASQPFFALAAVGMRAQQWAQMAEGVNHLKRRLFPDLKPTDFELKARDVRQGMGLFGTLTWQQRLVLLRDMVDLLSEFPAQTVAVCVDKRRLPVGIGSEGMYRMAFWRLLRLLGEYLDGRGQGLLMMDARSDLHSSVQDRRLVEAFREWQAEHKAPFVSVPWFGFSAFYPGLQLADLMAYLVVWSAREAEQGRRKVARALVERLLPQRLWLVEI